MTNSASNTQAEDTGGGSSEVILVLVVTLFFLGIAVYVLSEST